jgi:hypothetical protein
MSTRFLGALLIVIGLLAILSPVVRYTTEETVIDAGPLEVTAERERHVPIWQVAGGASVLGGLVLALRRRP